MVTIKNEKQLLFSELVQHIWDNVSSPETFIGQDLGAETMIVEASNYSITNIETKGFSIDEGTRFKVETEEKVELNTYIPSITEVYLTSEWDYGVSTFEHESINGIRDDSTLHLYALNKKGEMVLIWSRDGGLVE